jgi:acyl-CoA synthetase (NDP forming)
MARLTVAQAEQHLSEWPSADSAAPGWQAYSPGKREVVLGMVRDAHLGPLLMFGLGGLFVETIRDVAFRSVPLTDLDARKLIRAIRLRATK